MAGQINSRIILKHDSEENWNKAINFIPKQGEIIIYDKDDNYSYERIKIGDGETFVKDLPFIEENLKEQILSQINILEEGKMNKMDYLGPVVKEGEYVTYENGVEGLNISPTTYFSLTQSGTGEPSPNNIRAISGLNAINLTRCGKNLLNPSEYHTATTLGGLTVTRDGGSVTLNGTTTLTEAQTNDLILIPYNTTLPAGNYTLSGCPSGGGTYTYRLFAHILKADGTNKYISDTGSGTVFTIDTGDIVKTLSIRVGGLIGTVKNLTFKPQLEVGSAVTEYEPYQGDTYTVQFGNTIYGGVYDWATGELTVNHTMVTLDGTESWKVSSIQTGTDGTTRYDCNVGKNKKALSYECISSHYPYNGANENGLWISSDGNSALGIRIKWNYETVDALKAYLAEQYAAGTPVTIVYEVANPYTIQLTPQQIYALQGYNILFGNGDSIKSIFNTSGQVYSLENISGLLPIEKGGTGASTSAAARTALGVTAQNLISSIDGLTFNSTKKAIRYAICSTEDTNSAKTATITAGVFKLEKGTRITVKFSYANNTKIPTLNINQTGDKEIRWKNKTLTYWPSNSVLDFIYDGSYWQLIDTVSPIQVLPKSLGTVSGKTILELRSLLDEWLEEASTYVGASIYFSASSEWETLWNNENTTELLSGGSYWLLTVRSYNPSGGTNYVLLEINSYWDKRSWFLAKENGVWQKIQRVVFSNSVIDGGTWT